MLLGDPYKFGIQVEWVSEWSNESFKNGYLLIFMGGKIFPKEIYTFTYGVDISFFLASGIMNPVINIELFNEAKDQAYRKMYERSVAFAFYDEIEIEKMGWKQEKPFVFEIPTLKDYLYYFFAVSNGNDVRILGARLKETDDGPKLSENYLDISEQIITLKEWQNIIGNIEKLAQ